MAGLPIVVCNATQGQGPLAKDQPLTEPYRVPPTPLALSPVSNRPRDEGEVPCALRDRGDAEQQALREPRGASEGETERVLDI
jgi:hypothetical protein